MMSADSVFANNLRKLREDRGLTQEALAERAKVTPVTIRNYEKRRRRPGTKRLALLAAALKCTTDDLLVSSDGRPEAPVEPDAGLVRLEIIALLASGDHEKLSPILSSILTLVKDTLGSDVKTRKKNQNPAGL